MVLDTCILKLATIPRHDSPSALIVTLGFRQLFEWWASPAILDEYAQVIPDEPELLAHVHQVVNLCWPLTPLSVIRHEPDNRFVECALACDAEYLITVNTARGHFDQPSYATTRVVTPGQFVSRSEIQKLIELL